MLNNRFKKYLACLLTIAMICGSVVFPVMAEEGDAADPEVVEETVEDTIDETTEETVAEEDEDSDEDTESTDEDDQEVVSDDTESTDEDIPQEVEVFPGDDDDSTEVLISLDGNSFNAPAATTRNLTDVQYETIFERCDAACSAWNGNSNDIRVNVEGLGVTDSNWAQIAFRFRSEHNEYFFIRAIGAAYNDSGYTKLVFHVDNWVENPETGAYEISNYHGKTHTVDEVQKFNNKVDEILSGVDPLWTDTEKLLYFHDYIVTHCDYDTKAIDIKNDQEVLIQEEDPKYYTYDAYGCLVVGNCVCEGYARAFDCLCDRAGIDCHVVTSSANDHAWNIVNLDGSYYYIDCTDDDPVSSDQSELLYPGYTARCYHSSFLKNKSAFVSAANNHSKSTTDWMLDDWTNCSSYSTDSTYNSFFWNGYLSSYVFVGDHKWIGAQDYKFVVYDFSNDSKSYATISCAGQNLGTRNKSAFIKYGNYLIYSDGYDSIYKISMSNDLSSGTATLIGSNPTADAGDICGLSLSGTTLTYYVFSDEITLAYTGTINLDEGLGVPAQVTACGITLDGSIGINFLLTLPGSFVSNGGEVVISGPRGTMTYAIPAPEANGNYKFTYSVYSYEMDKPVTLTLSDSSVALIDSKETDCSEGFNYSVNRYIESAQSYLGNTGDLNDLLDALRVYGEYADAYFGNSGTQPAGIAQPDINNYTQYAAYSTDFSGSNGINYVGSSLMLQSRTALNHYFTLDTNRSINEYDFYVYVNGEKVKVTDGDSNYVVESAKGMYRLSIRNISAAQVTKVYDIEVRLKSNDAVVGTISNYCPLSYAYRIFTSGHYPYEDNQLLHNLVERLRLLNVQAVNYIK